MNRKRIWCAAAVLAVLCVPVRAQDWQSALKSVASNVADKATGGALTQLALVATWNYMQPGVKLESDNAVADLAASATTASLQSKLAGIYEKAGIKSGSCSVTFSKDSTFSLVIGSRTLKGTYAFESATHGITLTFSGSGELRKFGAMHGFAYLNGTDLQLLLFGRLKRFRSYSRSGEGRFSELFAGDGEQPRIENRQPLSRLRVCQIKRVISL